MVFRLKESFANEGDAEAPGSATVPSQNPADTQTVGPKFREARKK
jgi:hypothetical protein